MMLKLVAISLLTVSCQSVPTDQKMTDRKPTPAKPTPAKPLPSWTNYKGKASSSQQIQISTKLIEVSRPSDSAEIPTKEYKRTLNPSEYEAFIRGVSQRKGSDLMTAPSVITRDGQKTTLEVTKEFIYPLTPGEKPKLGTENTGVMSHYKAAHLGGRKVSLKTFTRVTEFEGFLKTQSEFELPVFNRRDVHSISQLKDGQTIILGGYTDTITQKIEDRSPLGLFKSSTQQKISRELIIAITVKLIKPDGSKL